MWTEIMKRCGSLLLSSCERELSYVTACASAHEKVAVVKFLRVWADAIPFSQEFLWHQGFKVDNPI
jgi:hypothetical protein